MKKNIIINLLLLFYTISAIAQQCPKIFIEGQFKKQYYPLGNALSQEYAIIGMYKESLIEEDRYDDGYRFRLLQEGNNIEAKKALPYIFKAIRENDIIILNENHFIPQHRALLYSIVDSFKTLGIQSVFLEALAYAPIDSLFYKNYPNTNFGSSITSENIYNQVLRKMSCLDLNLYSYEKSSTFDLDTTTIGGKKYIISKTIPSWEPIEVDNYILEQFYSDPNISRETEQALKIYQKLRANKIEKAFIYCGGSHEWKAEGYMAGILKHLLHKKVYVIDQLLLNEHSDKNFENILYRKYTKDTVPFVLIDNQQNILHKIYFPGTNDTVNFIIDMAVATPITVYKNNRPTWLELGGDRKRYPLSKFIDTNKYTENILVLIYDINEINFGETELIPMDSFQVQQNAANYDAILIPHKQYHLLAYRDGKIIIDKVIDAL